jgi:hypothetical protein
MTKKREYHLVHSPSPCLGLPLFFLTLLMYPCYEIIVRNGRKCFRTEKGLYITTEPRDISFCIGG